MSKSRSDMTDFTNTFESDLADYLTWCVYRGLDGVV